MRDDAQFVRADQVAFSLRGLIQDDPDVLMPDEIHHGFPDQFIDGQFENPCERGIDKDELLLVVNEADPFLDAGEDILQQILLLLHDVECLLVFRDIAIYADVSRKLVLLVEIFLHIDANPAGAAVLADKWKLTDPETIFSEVIHQGGNNLFAARMDDIHLFTQHLHLFVAIDFLKRLVRVQ